VSTITRVRVAVLKHHLSTPIYYGEWIMRHREFVLVRVDTKEGLSGFAYGLTRDGPISQIIGRSIAPAYIGGSIQDPTTIFFKALWTNHAVHASGIGMRALSLVDIAVWDALARSKELSLTRLLGGQPTPLPATAIVGYPPDTPAEEVQEQVLILLAKGWCRFKIPISSNLELSESRLRAVREAAPHAWIGFDINMVLRSAGDVLAFESKIRDLELGWIEDVVPPGDAEMVADVRRGSVTPVAMGDEQGGSYHPEALLTAGAVDVLRIDATTNGGISRMPGILKQADQAGVVIAPHMFPHVHSRLMAGLGRVDAPIEWGIPGTGVHPMDDGIEQPIILDGMMLPLADDPGLGHLVDLSWAQAQEVSDPDGALIDIPESAR
jgi:L-alanine-DL-glutamate epimerase-like enolase superfamily enzyme